MKKRDYFLLALKNECYLQASWVFSVFSITDTEDSTTPYSIVRKDKAYWFYNPASSSLEKLEDAKFDEPPFKLLEEVQISRGDIPNLKQDSLLTNYNLLFFNYVVLVYAFGDKLPYVEGATSAGKIEAYIAPRLQDTPDPAQERDPKYIYVDEYLKFTDAAFYLTTFTQLFIPTATEKAITVSPQVIALRDKLLKEYKEQLTDPAILAKIDAELVALDKEMLAGDDSEGFLIEKKSYGVIRKKLHYMLGAEEGFSENNTADPVLKSLSEGWDIEKFPTINSNLRAGSYNRGATTALGGDQVKWLLRASSNIRVIDGDCGSTIGVPRLITDKNAESFIGYTFVENKVSTKFTEENVKSYVGKTVQLRSPMFCKLDKTDYCKTCVGEKLSQHPTGLSVAVADYGSVFLALFLAKMHGTEMAVTKLDLNDTLF